MALMCRKGPTDAVAGMDPKFVRQESQSLTASIGALRADHHLPLFGLNRRGNSSCRQDGYRQESHWFRHALQHLFHFFNSPCFCSSCEYNKLKRESGARTVTAFECFLSTQHAANLRAGGIIHSG